MRGRHIALVLVFVLSSNVAGGVAWGQGFRAPPLRGPGGTTIHPLGAGLGSQGTGLAPLNLGSGLGSQSLPLPQPVLPQPVLPQPAAVGGGYGGGANGARYVGGTSQFNSAKTGTQVPTAVTPAPHHAVPVVDGGPPPAPPVPPVVAPAQDDDEHSSDSIWKSWKLWVGVVIVLGLIGAAIDP